MLSSKWKLFVARQQCAIEFIFRLSSMNSVHFPIRTVHKLLIVVFLLCQKCVFSSHFTGQNETNICSIRFHWTLKTKWEFSTSVFVQNWFLLWLLLCSVYACVLIIRYRNWKWRKPVFRAIVLMKFFDIEVFATMQLSSLRVNWSWNFVHFAFSRCLRIRKKEHDKI